MVFFPACGSIQVCIESEENIAVPIKADNMLTFLRNDIFFDVKLQGANIYKFEIIDLADNFKI